VVLLLGLAACGFAFGFATSSIPTPEAPDVFWASNLAAPWLALAFLAGWPQRSPGWGAVAGACADLACVVGFYLQSSGFVRLGVQSTSGSYAWEIPSGAPFSQRVIAPLVDWLGLMAPWLAAALVFGAAFGLLGARWGASRWLVSGLILALAFILEPPGWLVVHGSVWPPYVLWIVEVGLGVALLVWVVISSRRRARARAVYPAAGSSRGAAQQAHQADAQ
jgi:hypothetical protein